MSQQTIVIPTTNGRLKYLRKTLASLSSTSHKILVVVDAPASDEVAWLMTRGLDYELNYGGEGRNRGPSASINFAVNKFVKTEKFVVMHDDTFFHDGKHESVDKLLAKCTTGKIARGKVQAFDGTSSDEFYENFRQDEETVGGHFFAMTVADFKKMGGIHERLTMMPCGELEYLLMAGGVHGITGVYVDEAFAAHQRHDKHPNLAQCQRQTKKAIGQIMDEMNSDRVSQLLSKMPDEPVAKPSVQSGSQPNPANPAPAAATAASATK